jgi:hypothetical protein
VVHPPLKGVGELVFGDSSGAPSTAHLEAVLGQRDISPVRLFSWAEKNIHSDDIWRIDGWRTVFVPLLLFEVLD